MKPNVLLLVLLVIALGAGVWVLASRSNGTPSNGAVTAQPTPEPTLPPESVQGMYAEDNALVPTDQKPGTSLTVNKALLSKPGYVVIHEDAGGKAGAVLGSSNLLQAGEHDSVAVTLSRPSTDGEALWAMLHAESNGNTTFDPDTDVPVKSQYADSEIMAYFKISADAQPVDVSP